MPLGQSRGRLVRGEHDPLGDPGGQRLRLGGVERHPHPEEDVLQPHHAQTHRAPAAVGPGRLPGRVEVDVDHPVQERHGGADRRVQALPVHAVLAGERREVDRAEVADRRLPVVGDLQDLRAQVGGVDDVARLGGLVGGAVGGVLEGHPAVAGLREGAHHPAVQLARRERPAGQALGLGGPVGRVELLAPQVDQLGHVHRGEQRPLRVVGDPAHELVRHPVRQIQVVRTAGVLAGVVAQFEELLDVRVPGLQVDRGGALAAAALVHGGDRGVQRLQERDDAA